MILQATAKFESRSYYRSQTTTYSISSLIRGFGTLLAFTDSKEQGTLEVHH